MSWIWKNMSDQLKECFAGFAIPHGTDTLGGGSNSTSMMLGPNCPFSVGFVGAQKTTQHLYSDVGTNIRGLFDTLHTLKRQKKVARFVYMGGTEGGAFHPAGVIKIDDRHANAFRTPIHERLINASDFGLGGMIDRFGRRYMETLDREGAQKAFQPIILRGYAPVIDLTPKLGTNPALYYQQISTNESAIAVLLTTFGSYTVNPKVRKAITLAAQAKGKIVLGANPFPGGSTNHNYGPAKELRENGAYAVGTLPDATMIKVFLAHSVFGNNLPLLVQFLIENNFIGEQNPGEWMLNSEDGVVTPELDTSVSSMPRFGAPDAFFQKVKA
ncbi:MAG: hypothetical protein UW70_C0024G0002 [Candidatus Peregrinibacteria bacterium GW2011_GWA2_44_7]|nr:MAG: hypothetical protein UW70_C0024G0002 [Candidatus Peregrinibacteria bacterium GW2011_GWA2_44_7]